MSDTGSEREPGHIGSPPDAEDSIPPTVVTPKSPEDAFEHVMINILRTKEDGSDPLSLAFEQDDITDIYDLISLSRDAVDSLDYYEPGDKKKTSAPVPRGALSRVILFLEMIIYRQQVLNIRPTPDNICAVTREQFNDWRIDPPKDTLLYEERRNPGNRKSLVGRQSPPSSPAGSQQLSSMQPQPAPRQYSPADSFKKSIKRDQSLFPTLKDERYQDSWHQNFENQCRAQDLEDLISVTSKPTDPALLEVFELKQKWLYAVLFDKVQTTRGKAIVRKHRRNADAQAAYAELVSHHTQSVGADISASAIENYITTTKLGDGKFRGNSSAFITHFVNQMELHDTLTGSTYTDEQRLRFLSTAVKHVPTLHSVYTNASLLARHIGSSGRTSHAVSWSLYLGLLQDTAEKYDRELQSKPKRVVYSHEFGIQCIDEDQAPAPTYQAHVHDWHDSTHDDIDTPVTVLEANMTQSHQPRRPPMRRNVTMPKERWTSLDPQSRKIWDQLSDSAKSAILGYHTDHRSPSGGNTRQVHWHDHSQPPMDGEDDHFQDAHQDTPVEVPPDTMNVNQAASQPGRPPGSVDSSAPSNAGNKLLPPHDIRRVLGQPSTRGKVQASMAERFTYRVSTHRHRSKSSLVDRGANGGMAGRDVRPLHQHLPHREVDIEGIDNHRMNSIKVGTCAGVINTDKGPVIGIMHQYALTDHATSIHSPGQWEMFGHDVSDKGIRVGGLQRIKTADGYLLPLAIENGLPRLRMRPPTDKELRDLPHTVLTQPEVDGLWDPSVLDFDPEEADDQWFDAIEHLERHPRHNMFDEFGNYRRELTAHLTNFFHRQGDRPPDDPEEDNIDRVILHAHRCELSTSDELWVQAHTIEAFPTTRSQSQATDKPPPAPDPLPPTLPEPPLPDPEPPPPHSGSPRTLTPKEPDYAALRRFFGWTSADRVRKTLQHTTQLARLPVGTKLKQAFKAPNPMLNVLPRGEAVATDRIISSVPAIDCGVTEAQLFVGMKTNVTDIYPMSRPKEFVHTLEDNVRFRGRPSKLLSDSEQVEIHGAALDFMRVLAIANWSSEPFCQWQNPAERRIQLVKDTADRIMDRSGAPAKFWLHALLYTCFLLNHLWDDSIKNVPLTALTGLTVDTSVLLRFSFFERVYFRAIEPTYPEDSREEVGHIVGITEHVGNALCYAVYKPSTGKVVHRSRCRPITPDDPNHRAAVAGGESFSSPTKLSGELKTTNNDTPLDTIPEEDGEKEDAENEDGEKHTSTKTPMLISSPADLVGRTFLMDPEMDGTRRRATIVEMIEDFDDQLEGNKERIKYLCRMNRGEKEALVAYNKILEALENENDGVLWRYKRIISHQGPLRRGHRDYNGSSWNVMIEWENGEITTEPLRAIIAQDPVTVARYAKKHGLLETDGWKSVRHIAKNDKKFFRMAKQAHLHSFRSAPKYKYGVEIPKDYDDAMRLDRQLGQTKWGDATDLELKQIDDYQAFHDHGHKSKVAPPDGHKRIRVHLIYDCKHDGRHKARPVADGHLTDAPLESVHSGVVSLRGFRTVMFLAELNGLEFWATDIGNAYLESHTAEKVYIIAGPEFKELQGHILIIKKALYGLRSSGKRWHDKLFDCLIQLGFTPCKAEPDIWLRKNEDNIYEYVAVYVDDLAMALKDPEALIKKLQSAPFSFKLKGSGPITFHLGMDFFRDSDEVLCMAPKKYIEKMLANYERLFGEPPKQNMHAPLEKGDHPEMDTTELLDMDNTKIYQSLIGGLQWIVTIGRFDIMVAVMTLSSFRAAPRKGHLERVRRIYGYLSKMRHATIRVRTTEPDYSDLPVKELDWARTVYGALEEILPDDAPVPLGKPVTLTHYVDANLMHDMATGRSVTGILHFLNKTPLDWFSKKQSTVEVATYSSEMLAMRTCVEQIIDIRTTLRYLGVPIRDKSFVFGDNETVVNAATQVHAKLHKRHNMLSFHFVREAIARGFIHFTHIPGKENPADIMSKHWGYSDVWHLLKPMLFWEGDTRDA